MLFALSVSRLFTCGRKRPVSYGRGGAARGVAVSAQRRVVQVRSLAPGPSTAVIVELLKSGVRIVVGELLCVLYVPRCRAWQLIYCISYNSMIRRSNFPIWTQLGHLGVDFGNIPIFVK